MCTRNLLLVIFGIVLINSARGDNTVGKKPGGIGEPVAPQQFDLIFVGQFEDKEYYYGNESASQDEARAMCALRGMMAAQFDSMEEFNWLVDSVLVSANPLAYLWTDGILHVHSASFYWSSDDSEVANDLEVQVYQTFGVFFLPIMRDLLGEPTTDLARPLCYLEQPMTTSRIIDVENGLEVQLPSLINPSQRFDLGQEDIRRVKPDERPKQIVTSSLDYLGRYGTKFYYVDRQPNDWLGAENNCSQNGLRLAKIESLEEMVWLTGRTNATTDALLFTDGKAKEVAAYRWGTSGMPISNQFQISSKARLAFVRGAQPKFVTYDLFDFLPYLCTFSETMK